MSETTRDAVASLIGLGLMVLVAVLLWNGVSHGTVDRDWAQLWVSAWIVTVPGCALLVIGLMRLLRL